MRPPTSSSPVAHRVLAAVATAAAALLTGCGGGPPAASTDAGAAKPDAPSTRAAAPTDPEAERYAKAAADLQAIYEQSRAARTSNQPSAPDSAPATVPAVGPDAPTASPQPPAPTEFVGPLMPTEAEQQQPATPVDTPEARAKRQNQLIDELCSLLETHGDQGAGGDAFHRGIQLSVLEAIQPGVSTQALRRLEPDLTPAQAQALSTLREVLGQAASGSAAASDPAALAALLKGAAAKLAGSRGLAIQTVSLCERVDSFGRYQPFDENRFPAGRAQDVIVYVEVEGFSQRLGAGSDAAADGHGSQWVTELGQEVTLYSADGYQALYRPEQVVKDTSRRERRDYYLVQRITLPATLAIGRYTLKVTVRDKASRAEAESIVPVQIVEASRLVKSH